MIKLPHTLATIYRLAEREEVLSWSFGLVRNPTSYTLGDWKEVRETLDDQVIFGPKVDYQCACGQYSDRPELSPLRGKMVCDICGVKFTSSASRRQRMGHLELDAVVLADEQQVFDVLPILPAAYWENSVAGERLRQAYEKLLSSAREEAPSSLESLVAELFSLLSPVVIIATEWNLPEGSILARGLGLVPADGR
jgi:hypothetical protein